MAEPRTPFDRLHRWLVPGGSDAVPRPDSFFSFMRDFVGAVLRQPSRPEIRAARRVRLSRTLPFDLYLALGNQSIRVFKAGKVDELTFFERRGVSAYHDTEFLTRIDRCDRGTEEFGAYGVIRLYRGGRRLPCLHLDRSLRSRLARYGLTTLPDARALAVRPFSGYDPAEHDDPRQGRNRIAAPRCGKVFERVGMRRVFHADVLEILRRELTAEQTIAWIEESFSERVLLGEIVQRYYLSADKQLYMVRHHWGNGKLLFKAETSAEARRLVLESGAFRRPRPMAA